jgi:sulfite reductase (NADPH) hemoprotein beta-component
VQETDSDAPYVSILNQVFNDRLQLANVVSEASVLQPGASSPTSPSATATPLSAEYGLGLHLAKIQQHQRFVEVIRSHLASLPESVQTPLKAWLAPETSHDDAVKHGTAAHKALEAASKTQAVTAIIDAGAKHHLLHGKVSRWLLGGDRLAYDIGASGVHQVIASKANVNILVLDTQPYSEKISASAVDRRKKDIGLYAMTYGGVYVASVALNANFAGVVRALQEADAFEGPSVVLAYSPRVQTVGGRVAGSSGVSATAALAVLKEIKMAVDEGYWPLYRWTPPSPSVVAKLGGKDLPDPKFSLDSDKLRKELEEFLDRSKQLSLVTKAEPELNIPASVEQELQQTVTAKIQESYSALLASLNATPILVLYGSDGGNAASLAKRFAAEAKQRGLKPRVSVMDEIPVEDWLKHKHIVFVVSTAGQGEFPGNSRESWKTLQAPAIKELSWSSVHFGVMALGDSHYWPLPEDKHYFVKSGKDLDTKLEAIGATRLVNIGVGDDRGADGYMTGYKTWLPSLWSALGVDSVEVGEVAAAAPTDDAIKESSNFLRGTIAPGLLDETTGALAELDTKLTKFHGIYQQDDRDLRDARTRAGLEPAYSFMVRVRVPGGTCTPEQWVAVDDIAEIHANGTIKITTRQAFQFHGIIKKKLKKSIQDINHALMDTIAACGDVNRNVMCNPNPSSSQVHAEVMDFTRKFSTHLTPSTSAYHEIWLDKKIVVTSEDVEPIYGKTYLPRKFKVAVAVPPHNDVDVFAHDLGYIAISEGDRLLGFNVTVGGGMGMTHGMKATYPRIADVLGFCTVEQAVEVGEKVVTVQRDFGDRTNRKHARLKYTIEDRGIEWFKGEVEKRLGYKLQPAKPYKFISNGDRYGWEAGLDNTSSYTMYISNGRVKDTVERRVRSGMRAIAERLKGTNAEFRLTPNQHCMIANIPNSMRPDIEKIFAKYDLDNGKLSGLRLNSMACVALPTCTLAMAESERYLPDLIGKIEVLLEENGLRDDAITIRMTGCPNGCARPQIAEIGFIGKGKDFLHNFEIGSFVTDSTLSNFYCIIAPGTYNMYLGGGFTGERLSKIYKESITESEILKELKPIIKDYAISRLVGEHFGDFVIRKGYVKATLKGPDFHDV